VSRRLGQHFLTDPSILERIVDALYPQDDDTVIEIGPGKGTLTCRLAPRVAQVIAIEKDKSLARQLRSRVESGEWAVGGEKVRIVAGDALQLDWHELAPPTFKVVGNIPYYITSPLIAKTLSPPLPTVIVYLVQREVADRLGATPGSKTYGALSVGVQVVARVERLFVVPAGAFHPRPRVDSAVVRFTPLEVPLVSSTEHAGFRAFVVRVFGQRRKQLVSILRSTESLSRDQALTVLTEAGIDSRSRPEVLSPHEFVRLRAVLAR
jgi:16S rRNA (adenine1518-N6/adenine1519-N6)-dimethyltransferase